MSKIEIGDKMTETKLIEKSNALNISIGVLIDRYIRRGLFIDDYYEPRKLTREELLEISRKELEKDIKKGYPPVKHDFSAFIGFLNKYDD